MGDETPCPHAGLYWYAAPADERGWRCVDCQWEPGEPPGFSPRHDRERIGVKVGCIVHALHEAQIIYVSNGCEGDALTARVASMCEKERYYDSVTIARFILQVEGGPEHGRFWRDASESVLAGKAPPKTSGTEFPW